MSKPGKEVEDKQYFKDIHFLYEILYSLKNVEEVKLFLKDILTKSELKMLKRRWHIANLLYEGFDIRTVAFKSKTSTTTVLKIKQILDDGTGGIYLALKKTNKIQNKEKKKILGGSKYVKNWF